VSQIIMEHLRKVNNVSLTVITASKPSVLSKSFWLNDDGALVKQSGGELLDGIAELWTGTFSDYVELIQKLTPRMAT